MRRLALFLFCILIAVVCLASCGQRSDPWEVFSSPFEAELDGTLYGEHFAARVKAEDLSENGGRTVTVTFYAPEALSGTVLCLEPGGRVTLSLGDITLEGESLPGAALLSLFPAGGRVLSADLTDEGNTRLSGEGISVLFSSDGRPMLIQTDAVSATVVRFQQK